MAAIFLQGNALSVLKGLPSDLVHCVVTSPPYWGLRKYKGGSEVWDGEPGCEHEWLDTSTPRTGGVGNYEVGRAGNALARTLSHESKKSDTCSKCGAWRGQLGNEPAPELYISHLVGICREVRRVLRPDGVFWLNCGDSWASGKGTCFNPGGGESSLQGHATLKEQEAYPLDRGNKSVLTASGLKPLDMVLIPSLLALTLRADGWYMRSMVCWSKNNPMPESTNGWRWERHKVKVGNRGRATEAWREETHQQDHAPDGDFLQDAVWQDCPGCPKCSPADGFVLRKGSWRPTDSYEFILMLTKTNDYYCDRDAVLESSITGDLRRPYGSEGAWELDGRPSSQRHGGEPREMRQDYSNYAGKLVVSDRSKEIGSRDNLGKPSCNGGRNLRSVWTFPTRPFPKVAGMEGLRHFATYPPRLPELCIKSSTSEKGCCPACGAPWARVIDKGLTAHDGDTDCSYPVGSSANRMSLLRQAARERGGEYSYKSDTIGWRPTCQCGNPNTVPAIVLDLFSGAGTTALVAERMGLNSISIDTSAEYIALSRARLAEDESKRLEEFIKKAKSAARGREVRMT